MQPPFLCVFTWTKLLIKHLAASQSHFQHATKQYSVLAAYFKESLGINDVKQCSKLLFTNTTKVVPPKQLQGRNIFLYCGCLVLICKSKFCDVVNQYVEVPPHLGGRWLTPRSLAVSPLHQSSKQKPSNSPTTHHGFSRSIWQRAVSSLLDRKSVV